MLFTKRKIIYKNKGYLCTTTASTTQKQTVHWHWLPDAHNNLVLCYLPSCLAKAHKLYLLCSHVLFYSFSKVCAHATEEEL